MRARTLAGSVELKIPPGTRSSQRLRVGAQGLPKGDDSRGDLYLRAIITMPKTLSEAQKKLLEELGEIGTPPTGGARLEDAR